MKISILVGASSPIKTLRHHVTPKKSDKLNSILNSLQVLITNHPKITFCNYQSDNTLSSSSKEVAFECASVCRGTTLCHLLFRVGYHINIEQEAVGMAYAAPIGQQFNYEALSQLTVRQNGANHLNTKCIDRWYHHFSNTKIPKQ